jgi:hypothetical protein
MRWEGEKNNESITGSFASISRVGGTTDAFRSDNEGGR